MAYLHVAELLRPAKDCEARVEAKNSLQPLPSGALNIATRTTPDAGSDTDPQEP